MTSNGPLDSDEYLTILVKFEKGTFRWLISEDKIPDTAVSVHRKVAERLEDSLNDQH